MTDDNRSSKDIERDIEREREGLTETLDELQDKFSMEGISRQVSEQFRVHGGEMTRSLTDAVKRNPMALALTGVGLAWLVMGDRDRGHSYPERHEDRDYRKTGTDAWSNQSRRGRNYYGSDPAGASDLPTRRPGTTYPAGYSTTDETHLPSWAKGAEGHDSSRSEGMTDKAREMGQGASDKAREMGQGVSEKAREMGDRASQTAGSMSERAKDAANSASHRAEQMRARLSQGTEQMTEEARARVLAARQRAMEARSAAMRYTRESRDYAADMYEDYPLVAGALAVAVGAAVAAGLPRSRMEDRNFGAQSDALIEEAERIFEEEREKLSRVAKAATDEARDVARETAAELDETAKSAEDKVAEKALASGDRVAKAAKEEADRQNLGDVKR